ncbi:unnamed protein product [Caenorhabditis bovis]|uniref:Uncharacterized protein n=1 Tax=Caenorhabditis bovis TaxID=2654633 RepID=A0A8S1FDH2_9PELO|nr:unnamed protein product [Caenorhabditis bovis]
MLLENVFDKNFGEETRLDKSDALIAHLEEWHHRFPHRIDPTIDDGIHQNMKNEASSEYVDPIEQLFASLNLEPIEFERDTPIYISHHLVAAMRTSGAAVCRYHKKPALAAFIVTKTEAGAGFETILVKFTSENLFRSIWRLALKVENNKIKHGCQGLKLVRFFNRMRSCDHTNLNDEKALVKEIAGLPLLERQVQFHFALFTVTFDDSPHICSWHGQNIKCCVILNQRKISTCVTLPFCESCMQAETNQRGNLPGDIFPVLRSTYEAKNPKDLQDWWKLRQLAAV